MEQEPKKFSIKNFLKSLLREIILPVALALVVIQYVIQAFQIPSGSMEDSLHTGDFLLGLKFTYGSPVPFTNKHFPGYTEPKPGDVVIFRYPGEPEYPDNDPERYTHLFNALMFGNFYWDHEPAPGQPHLVHFPDGPKDYIKRCVAVAGDTVAVHQGRLYINGVRQDTLPGRGKWTKSVRTMTSPRDEREPFVVPSVGDELVVDSLSLEMLWWLRSIVLQENPDSRVELDLSLWEDGVERNNYYFENFMVPKGPERTMLEVAFPSYVAVRNGDTLASRTQTQLLEGDTLIGSISFGFFREKARKGFLPIPIPPEMQSSWKRLVSYYGFDGAILGDLERNVALLNEPVVISQDSTEGDSSLANTDSTVAMMEPAIAESPKLEIRRRLLVDGKPIDRYVVKTPLFFMMGDNRDNSADSRYWGFVNLRSVRAKAAVIYFSFDNDDQAFALGKPWTWWRIPFKIRWSRIGKVIPLIGR